MLLAGFAIRSWNPGPVTWAFPQPHIPWRQVYLVTSSTSLTHGTCSAVFPLRFPAPSVSEQAPLLLNYHMKWGTHMHPRTSVLGRKQNPTPPLLWELWISDDSPASLVCVYVLLCKVKDVGEKIIFLCRKGPDPSQHLSSCLILSRGMSSLTSLGLLMCLKISTCLSAWLD